MRDGDVDYSRYSLRELEEALASIDRKHYPQNYAKLRDAYIDAAAREPPEPEAPDPPDDPREDEDPRPEPKYDAQGRYVPNRIPNGRLAGAGAAALLAIAYASYGIVSNDLYMPAKHGQGLHFHGRAMWLFAAALALFALLCLLRIADHFDVRDNEITYWRARRVLSWTMAIIFVSAMLLALFAQ